MTKKDYIAFARMIRVNMRKLDGFTRDFVINSIAQVFENDNPRFNRAKFYEACGYKYE